MSFIGKFTPRVLRDGRRQPSRGAAGAGWRVAYGNACHAREDSLWQDEGFAVLEGPWETFHGGRFVAVGEARLTNRAELLTEIDWPGGAADVPTDIPTDLTIIVSLWQAQGRRAAELLTGAYAFCVWDRERETLWLVRDRVGVATLYFTMEGGVRYAGARSREVVSGATREVDAVAVRDYLCCAFVPGGRTMWRALREVRPGTVVRLPEGETTSYWQVEERVAGERMSLESYGARLRAALEQVVSDCLPDGAPVGAIFPAGLIRAALRLWPRACTTSPSTLIQSISGRSVRTNSNSQGWSPNTVGRRITSSRLRPKRCGTCCRRRWRNSTTPSETL